MVSPSRPFEPKNGLVKWFDRQLPVLTVAHGALVAYPTPKNLNYWWSFGSLAGLLLVVQIVTGIVLGMHYTPHADMAFGSVEHIMRDVNYGWLLRYTHANGAAFFFMIVYIHIFRGLYYGSYKGPRELLWMLGLVIFLLMMATAFMGYVLPWGQMSYWAATVITNLFAAIPWVGEAIKEWLLGGYVVGNPTLNRFFSLHYVLPFVIAAVAIMHIWALHIPGSNNPLGIDVKGPQDQIDFHPYHTAKDLFMMSLLAVVFFAFVFYAPNFMGHPDNYIPADSMVTPPHIVPEWYFLPFYAILRSVPALSFLGVEIMSAKLFGVIAMFAAILLLFALPWLDRSPVRSATFRPTFRLLFWVLVIDVVILGFVGAKVPSDMAFSLGGVGLTWEQVGLIGTIWYFLHFLVFLPLLPRFETTKALPESISEPVLQQSASA